MWESGIKNITDLSSEVMKMGVISDAIDSLETWCSNLFKDGIKSQFDGISDLLSDTFANTTGSDGKQSLIQIFIAKHPAQFTT